MLATIIVPETHLPLAKSIHKRTDSYVKTKTIMKQQYGIDIYLRED